MKRANLLMLSAMGFFWSTFLLAQPPDQTSPLLPNLPYPDATDLQATVNNNLTDMVNQNRDAVDMHQVEMHSHYPDLRRITYDAGILTLKPSWNEGDYSYTYDGNNYTTAARDISIQLFNPETQRSMTENLSSEINSISNQVNTIEQQLYSLNGTGSSFLIQQITKQGRAISVNAAFSAIPSGYLPDKNFIGVGIGQFDHHTAVAVGLTRRFNNGLIIQGKYGISEDTSVAAAGAGVSF